MIMFSPHSFMFGKSDSYIFTLKALSLVSALYPKQDLNLKVLHVKGKNGRSNEYVNK